MSPSNRTNLLCAGGLALLLAIRLDAAPPAVTLQVERTEVPSVVRMTLVNASQSPFVISRAFLPWRQANVKAAAIQERSEKPLDRGFSLDAAPPGTLTVPAGGSVSEKVDLAAWFPRIKETLALDNVVVYFAYDFRGASRTAPTRIYAGVTLERSR